MRKKQKKYKKYNHAPYLLFLLSLLCFALTSCAGEAQNDFPENQNNQNPDQNLSDTDATPLDMDEITLSGTQNVVIEGFDWGPAVTKTILNLDDAVSPDSLSADLFSVLERKESFDYSGYARWSANGDTKAPLPPHIASETVRAVTDVYPCDAFGNQVTRASDYIALELACNPDIGSPYCFDLTTWHNTICDPYELTININNKLRTESGAAVGGLNIDPFIDLQDAFTPQLDAAEIYNSFQGDDGRVLLYADYRPVEDGKKHPFIIWLHGAGEGGSDPSIVLLGNKTTALFDKKFQDMMGGAYILAPQVPDFWMVYNQDGDWQDNPGVSSVYNQTLMQLIDEYANENAAIDKSRVYIGGCSNGGYMAMDMILTHPYYFAAAYLICEAYPDSGITDTQLDGIQNLPVWFVYAENDDTVDPETHEIPTIQRLREIGADVHVSVFPDVRDTSGLYHGQDGAPYEYSGHWSWLYFFNDECQENGVKLWSWMSKQSN